MFFLKKILMNFGRMSFAMIFILSGINKIIQWNDTESGFVSLLCDWHTYSASYNWLQNLFSDLLPYVTLIIVMATIIELIGGVLLFLGIKSRLAAFFILLFFVPTTILFHHFWFLEGFKREIQMIMFMKNIAIIGGLFMVLAGGAKIEENPSPGLPAVPEGEKSFNDEEHFE